MLRCREIKTPVVLIVIDGFPRGLIKSVLKWQHAAHQREGQGENGHQLRAERASPSASGHRSPLLAWSRTKALLTMTSPLGEDVLIPTSLAAEEGLSQTFSFKVEAVSQNGSVDPDKLLNQPACVTLQTSGVPVRRFHGIVQAVSSHGSTRGSANDDYYIYRLTLVPRLWFLSQTVDCRVFQELSVPDILRAMFKDAGLVDFTLPEFSGVRP